MSNMKFPVLHTLKICQKCLTVPAVHRNIRTLHTKIASVQYRELHWTYQQTIYWRQLLTHPKHARTFTTSPHIFGPDEDDKKLENQFKDDPEAKELLKEMTRDFNNEQGVDSNPTSVLTEIKDETSSSESDTESSSDSDRENELGKDTSKHASTPNITEKSEYIIMQDDMVYDYEELDEDYVEAEEPAEEVYLPISLERGTTGVFDLSELVELLSYENVQDVCAISMPKEIQYVDYMVIVSARSLRHCTAVAAAVKWFYKQKASRKMKDPNSVKIEGAQGSQWLAMDLGNIALHIFMPTERRKYDLESLWTVGAEFDENVQQEQMLEGDPFAAYLKDFGQKTDEREDDNVPIKVAPKAETAKRPYAKFHNLESSTAWHSTQHKTHE